MNNETYGISVEIAIAEEYGVPVNPDYADRADWEVVENIRPLIVPTFEDYGIPIPTEHVAEASSPVDFLLDGYDDDGEQMTLSVKSNFHDLGRAAPQVVGQPTDMTWYELFYDYASEYATFDEYEQMSYDERAYVFKQCVLDNPAALMSIYFEHIFECTWMFICYNIDYDAGASAETFPLGRYSSPIWYDGDFSFTRDLENWNESNTIKYAGVSIGEFQVHSNRNCFKFRFHIDKLSLLIEDGAFTF